MKDSAIDGRIFQWSKKNQLAKAMLWFALWEYFDAYQAGVQISLTKDWSVVLTEDQGPDMPPFIRAMFGGPRQV